MFSPGDVIKFQSYVAGKTKFHLCISFNGAFLFINSPKQKTFAGDFVVPCSEIDCLDPTPSGKSVISCSLIVRMSEQDLRHTRAEKIGKVKPQLIRDVLKFIEASPVLSAEDQDFVSEQLGDWLGT